VNYSELDTDEPVHLCTVAFHLCCSSECALQASRSILDFLQFPLQAFKFRFALLGSRHSIHLAFGWDHDCSCTSLLVLNTQLYVNLHKQDAARQPAACELRFSAFSLGLEAGEWEQVIAEPPGAAGT
jgi:hypothetical protein